MSEIKVDVEAGARWLADDTGFVFDANPDRHRRSMEYLLETIGLKVEDGELTVLRPVSHCPKCDATGADQSCVEDGELTDDHDERGPYVEYRGRWISLT